ncbi:MAG: hypothetical protein P8N76_05870 [Pirellulaceae bacterium]|nr:hypothetical protein [Pirellulaceae bacterium]
MKSITFLFLVILTLTTNLSVGDEPPNTRRPSTDAELESWLQNMVWYHRFSPDEIRAATGLSNEEIKAALKRFQIRSATRPKRSATAPLLMLPYPGGRHPRIGFLDGAINPQRETKLSVFTPWDESSYVVLDVPEAIWSNLGLTYLAHTHIPTVWDQRGEKLEKLEWQVNDDGAMSGTRSLPNGIKFRTRVWPDSGAIRMKMWLTNGSKQALSDLRVQNCVMLKAAAGFEQQTNDNKFFRNEYAVCHSKNERQWIITAWSPLHRTWANAPCPCLHSDPRFPDCKPGETQQLSGWLSFYEGDDIEAELKRIDQLNWQD